MVNGSAGAFLQAQRRRHQGWGLCPFAHMARMALHLAERPYVLAPHRQAAHAIYMVIAISCTGNMIAQVSEAIFLAQNEIEMARMMKVLDADLLNDQIPSNRCFPRANVNLILYFVYYFYIFPLTFSFFSAISLFARLAPFAYSSFILYEPVDLWRLVSDPYWNSYQLLEGERTHLDSLFSSSYSFLNEDLDTCV